MSGLHSVGLTIQSLSFTVTPLGILISVTVGNRGAYCVSLYPITFYMGIQNSVTENNKLLMVTDVTVPKKFGIDLSCLIFCPGFTHADFAARPTSPRASRTRPSGRAASGATPAAAATRSSRTRTARRSAASCAETSPAGSTTASSPAKVQYGKRAQVYYAQSSSLNLNLPP